MYDNKKLVYRVERELSDGGYTIDNLRVGEYSEEDAALRLAGTVDNKDGYSTDAPDKGAEVAARMGRTFAALLRDGHAKFYDWHCGAHSFGIRYQVYKNADAERPDYCQPRIQFPDEISGAKWALKLIGKFGRKIEQAMAKRASERDGHERDPGEVDDQTIGQLQDVTEALDKIGAVRCEWWTGPPEGWYSPPRYMVVVKK